MSITYFRRLMRHAVWANRRVLNVLQTHAPEDAEPVRLFTHVLTTEAIYLERMQGLDPWPQNFWPTLNLTDCARLVEENPVRYNAFFDTLTDASLAESVLYRNSRGMRFETPLRDMLTHVFMHGSYHRGQIATALRARGYDPVNTDFIVFTRDK